MATAWIPLRCSPVSCLKPHLGSLGCSQQSSDADVVKHCWGLQTRYALWLRGLPFVPYPSLGWRWTCRPSCRVGRPWTVLLICSQGTYSLKAGHWWEGDCSCMEVGSDGTILSGNGALGVMGAAGPELDVEQS